MSEEDLDFEISFYEELIRDKPDFVDVLVALGNAYTRKGLFAKGLEVDLKLVGLRPDDAVARYNLACDYSLLKMTDECLRSLEEALRLGYRDFAHMESDPDLEHARQDPRYRDLIAAHRAGGS